MIPKDNKHSHQVESTLGGEEIQMTIDQNSLQFIIHALTNLYSNVPFCLLREYANNALDSHVEAGNPLPVQVILPTAESPTLRIRDYGVGLNAEDIREVYSKYGASTKRKTDDTQGSFGLGAKSALAYATQFSVVGIKDGVLTQVSVGLSEGGIGFMTIVDTSETDKANGVEVIIPVRAGDMRDFHKEAAHLFSFWTPGTVLIDGMEPDVMKGLEITPEISLYKDTSRDQYGYVESRQSYVVMANTPYPIDRAHFPIDLPASYSIVAQIPNGSVQVTPSRELLDYTAPDTREVLNQLAETLQSALVESIEKEITAAQRASDAVRVVLKWRSALPKVLSQHVFKYQQAEIPDQIVAPDSYVFLLTNGKDERDYNGKRHQVGKHSRVRAIDLTMVTEAIWVWNFNRSFTPTVKRKLWYHFDQVKREYPPNFIMCQDKPDSLWIDPDNIIKWDPIEALKLPRKNTHGRTNSGRIPGSYDLYMYLGAGEPERMNDIPGDDIDDSMPLYWTTNDNMQYYAQRLAKVEEEFSLVFLRNNRVAKFKRLFPQARESHVVLREYHNDFMDMLTERERQAITFHQSCARTLTNGLPQRGIADPEIASLRELAALSKSPRIQRLKRMLGEFSYVEEKQRSNTLVMRYPLTDDTYSSIPLRRKRRHNLIYINAAYKELYA